MKKYLLPLLAAALFTASTATAQTTPTTRPEGGRGRQEHSPDEQATRQSERLTKELGLSADQSARIKQISLTQSQEMQASRGQRPEGQSREAMGEQMKANRAKYDAQYKEVLTPEQYTKYTALQANRMNRGGGKGPGGHGQDGL